MTHLLGPNPLVSQGGSVWFLSDYHCRHNYIENITMTQMVCIYFSLSSVVPAFLNVLTQCELHFTNGIGAEEIRNNGS